jgi:hypothetical protein
VGRIVCPAHGTTGITIVCPHISQAVRDSAPLPARSIVAVDFEGETALELTFCTVCIEAHDIQTRVTSDELEQFSDSKFKHEAVCAKCFAG